MKPFFVLIIVFIVSAFGTKILGDSLNIVLAGKIGMAAMLLFTAIGHFVYKKGMTIMIPKSIPFKTTIVLLTGIIEIMAAIGLLISGLTLFTAWFLIVFFYSYFACKYLCCSKNN